MDVLAFALQMEKDGEAYYRQLAHRTANTGLRTILNMLADEEVKHQQVIDRLKGEVTSLSPCELLVRAKNIFAEMKDDESLLVDESNQVEMYEKALELEKKSQAFYEEKATEVNPSPQAEVLRMLSQEEARHVRLLQHIIDFVARPQRWLEDAEYTHLDEF